ncbi:MAG: hypothetical protein AAGB11_08405 [Pseudomonadota bacterium]
MTDETSRFFALHQLAARSGEGLRPEFEALLRRHAGEPVDGVVRFDPPTRSAGPAHQMATKEQLEDPDITVLPAVQNGPARRRAAG